MKTLIQTSILIFLLSLFSCLSITQSIIGVKDPKPLTDVQITKYSKSFKVDQFYNYRIDTSYLDFILKLDTTKFKAQRKNHIQPLQALFFKSSGELQKFYINCYAGGFPNLKWNREGILNTFLPKDQAPIDTILNLKRQLSYLRPVCSLTKESVENTFDYYIVVYWNKCTKRHSKRLIKSIQYNVSKASTEKVIIIYANYDNVFTLLEKNNDNLTTP
jgi:hypothetical protein